MKKTLALVCLIGVSCLVFATPATASSRIAARPPVDGGYIRCSGNTLISEVGIKFRHNGYPDRPTVFHVVPAEAGRSFGEELLEAITPTTRPSKRTRWLSYASGIPGVQAVAIPAAGISYFFDIKNSRDNKFGRYITEFYHCLNHHTGWINYVYHLILSGETSVVTVKSWSSIEMQLLCHAAGAAIPDPGTLLGGATWDLEGYVGEPPPSIDPLDLVVTSACQWDRGPFSWIPVPWG